MRGGLFVSVGSGFYLFVFILWTTLGEGWEEEQKSKKEKDLLNNLTAKVLFLTKLPSCFLVEQEEGLQWVPNKHQARNLLCGRHSTHFSIFLLWWILSRKHFEDNDKLVCHLCLCLTNWPRNFLGLLKCYQASCLQLKAMYAWPFHTIFNFITDRAWIIVPDNSRANRLCPRFPMIPLAQCFAWRWRNWGLYKRSQRIMSHFMSHFCLRSQWPESSINYA